MELKQETGILFRNSSLHMKKALTTLLAIFAVTLTASAMVPMGWTDDYTKAQATAKAERKLVLLDFTGSDWCGWCMKLDREVFSTQAFRDYAKANLVLVQVDFPRRRALQKNVQDQNNQLAGKFGVNGYPTIIILNGEGKQVGKLGYMPGGPAAFIAALNRLPKS